MSGRAYVYDGSVEGLFSVMFRSFEQREIPTDVVRNGSFQLRLGQDACFVETDVEIALRAARGLGRVCGRRGFNAVLLAALSDESGAGVACVRFFHKAMEAAYAASGGLPCTTCAKKRTCVDSCARLSRARMSWDISDRLTGEVLSLERAVLNERHRMLQFLRFEELEGGVWFARCNPNASVVPLVMDHFAERFNCQDFMIYDEIHGILGMFSSSASLQSQRKIASNDLLPIVSRGLSSTNGRGSDGRWWVVKTDSLELPDETKEESEMKRAWQAFYDSVSVEERFNPELRRSFIPVRLWRNVVELRHEA